jgi:hypothetical protein
MISGNLNEAKKKTCEPSKDYPESNNRFHNVSSA